MFNFTYLTRVNQLLHFVIYNLVAFRCEFTSILIDWFVFRVDVQLVSANVWTYACHIFMGPSKAILVSF